MAGKLNDVNISLQLRCQLLGTWEVPPPTDLIGRQDTGDSVRLRQMRDVCSGLRRRRR